MILSILIPTIPSRWTMFFSLYSKVYAQVHNLNHDHPTLGQVGILIDESKSFLNGGLSIGKKREALVKAATGEYLCFLDDDEDISPNYVETLVRLCHENKDVCTFRNISKFDNYWAIIDMSLAYTENEEARPNGITKRRPFHICPVRTKYAKMHDFEDINYGEDFKWMVQVLNHCETEAKTNAVLHCYNHSSKHSESDKITKHSQDAI